MNARIDLAAKAAFLFSAVLIAACQGGGYEAAQNAALDTDDQKASYAIGLQIGGSLADIEDHVDMDAFLRGMQDAMSEREPVIAQAELQEVMMRFQQTIGEEQQARMEAESAANLEAGEAFLAENAAKDGVMVTESGLQYEVMREAEGPKPTPEDEVTIHYRGTLIDGTEFDSSYGRGEPTTFQVGGVIAGFAEALQLMPVGSQYRFVIPGSLGYGPAGNGAMIGPNATLIFEIELIGVGE
ncbi:MAG TPA: FKBP-type peptidyl-prolyl cis-trans isomerase [Longimicrobiales bacterium]|nr:FKBP-type peptidyl-prolyl cis-trans isomerase [Longimicrobiales bacterium]